MMYCSRASERLAWASQPPYENSGTNVQGYNFLEAHPSDLEFRSHLSTNVETATELELDAFILSKV